MVRRACWVMALLCVTCAPPSVAAPLYQQLRLIAPAAPGGGWDQTARAMQQVLLRAGLVSVVPVENIPGAAGTIGLARFVGAERGAPDVLMVSGLIMLGGIVEHRSPVTLRDATPIARLTGEYEVIAVPTASPVRSLRELITALKQRPEAISWGGGSAGGSDQMLAGLVADAVGVLPRRINYIAFSGGGESLSAILGGQVSVGINGLAEFEPQMAAGTLRALAISSAERIPGVDVPTLREQGVDVVFENWRSLVAPPGIAPAERQRLDALVNAMVHSSQWRSTLQQYRWLDRYLAGEEFGRFAAGEETRVRDILHKLSGDVAGQRSLTSAGAYPLFVLGGVMLLGIGAFIESRRRAVRLEASTSGAGAGAGSLALLALGIVLHLLLAEPAGFVIACTVLFWCAARAFDARHPLRDALFAIAISASAYLLFARVLQLTLPAGVLARWL